MSTERTRMLFTTERYERMVSTGVLGKYDRVELIEGEIVEMSPIGNPHAACANRLTRLLVTTLGDRAIVSVQNSISLPPRSMPQPDLTVLKARDDFYSTVRPTAADTLLLIEVADTSVLYNRTVKAPIYAKGGVEHMWLVNLPAETVQVYSDPSETGYSGSEVVDREGSVTIDAFPDLALRVADILG